MRPLLLPALAVATAACAVSAVSPPAAKSSAPEPSSTVVLTPEVEWEQLNPARGDKSPMAATLWGDRSGRGPTGFLFRPVDGFESPPHIHNVSYRGVVISGRVHNDDPKAEEVWLPTGSFWTQPKGGVHITAARGRDILAYIEIERGPYLVLPVDQAFQSDEAPIKMNPSDIPWIDPPEAVASSQGLKVALLWGERQGDQPRGTLVKLPVGCDGGVRSQGLSLRAVMIQGRAKYRGAGGRTVKTIDPGSFFSSRGNSAHWLSCESGNDCVIYARTEGRLELIPAQ